MKTNRRSGAIYYRVYQIYICICVYNRQCLRACIGITSVSHRRERHIQCSRHGVYFIKSLHHPAPRSNIFITGILLCLYTTSERYLYVSLPLPLTLIYLYIYIVSIQIDSGLLFYFFSLVQQVLVYIGTCTIRNVFILFRWQRSDGGRTNVIITRM